MPLYFLTCLGLPTLTPTWQHRRLALTIGFNSESMTTTFALLAHLVSIPHVEGVPHVVVVLRVLAGVVVVLRVLAVVVVVLQLLVVVVVVLRLLAVVVVVF